MKYQIIAADPPWDYKGQRQHTISGKPDTGGALSHYPTMTVDEMIRDFRTMIDLVRDSDCLLFMWTTWPHLNQAITLGEGWGFRYVHTPFIWHKQRTNPGYYTLTETEPVLCFKQGRIPKPRGSRNERQVINSARQRHSQKPDEFFHRVDRMFPTQKKLELFARTHRPGWDCWGNEV